MNDKDVQNKAMADWKAENGKAFPHLEAWLVLVKHEKYKGVPSMSAGLESSSQKRTKTSESGNYTSSSNDIPDLNEDTTPNRPPRKSKTKGKAVVSDSTSKEKEDGRKEKMEIRRQVAEARVERDRKSVEIMNQERKIRDLKFFNEPHDHLQEPNKTITLDLKREIAARYE